MAKADPQTPRYVVVTTAHRGVFFGKLKSRDGSEVVLSDARNCVQWSSLVRGFLGLASSGPDGDCRIGPKVPQLTLTDITSITDCTDEAVEKWEVGPWR